ncbi:MAG: type II toxin-antitoxin system toxin DNA ADP-ribosyl transferase DarT [Terriglobales bacterium]
MPQPAAPKIYHIVHVDRLQSIANDGFLWSDAVMMQRQNAGTTIGMSNIKQRRLTLGIGCRPGLHVGECVPFYFCPRSVMLYLLHSANHPELTYRGGQGPILHLQTDLNSVVTWAQANGKRWAFTLSNAGARYFEDRCNLAQLAEINWDAVEARKWSGNGVSSTVKEGKQAEFLIEERFPWALVERIGILSQTMGQRVMQMMQGMAHRPPVEIRPEWYY